MNFDFEIEDNGPTLGSFLPGGLLEEILRTAPGDKLMLRIDIIFDSEKRQTLSAYRMQGQPMQRLAYEDRQGIDKETWNDLLAMTGWTLTTRPAYMGGVTYDYFLERANGDQDHYGLQARDEEAVERMHLERAFSAMNPEMVTKNPRRTWIIDTKQSVTNG